MLTKPMIYGIIYIDKKEGENNMTKDEMYQYLETWKKRALSAVPDDQDGLKDWLEGIHQKAVEEINVVKEEMNQANKNDVTPEQEKDWEDRIGDATIRISLATTLYFMVFYDNLMDAVEVVHEAAEDDDEVTAKA